jgi:phospholipase/carboxylesterase
MLEPLETINLEPKNCVAKRSVIFLHGLGADGHDFVPVVASLGIQQEYKIRFIFPHAPSMPVTINNNYIMPAWFDVYGLDKNSCEDAIGIEKTRLKIEALIQAEHAKGIEYNNIVLAGFSQGGVIALYSALKCNQQLAGVIGLSCYLPNFDKNYSDANKNIKIFIAHGVDDTVVNYSFGRSAFERLVEQGYHVDFKSYQMQHNVCATEITDMANYLKLVFKF